MGERIDLNNDWEYFPHYTEKLTGLKEKGERVRLPHTICETPYHYFDERCFQRVVGYRRILELSEEWRGKSLLLTIEGAAHKAEVYLNGEKIGEHACGYTAFTMDIGEKVLWGEEQNILVIKVDSREKLNIPPFGHVIDYMTYGGLYREVYLEIKEREHIQDVFPQAGRKGNHGTLDCQVTLSKACRAFKGQYRLEQYLYDKDEKQIAKIRRRKAELDNVELWDTDNPALYTLESNLYRNGKLLDSRRDRLGFREAVFRADGFYLNGKKKKLRGLNRHQSFPYVGYAMPASMQKWDAELLKNELGVNAVRTSHYPQSQHFINRCDELGLLVFTEIPGWQHIGDEEWKRQAQENTREMVEQYRNHPSVILWGVRINESLDDDAFYRKTNRIAHRLDKTRQTSGVRYLEKSSLLEDVYAFNDFSHHGENPGCRPKKKITPDDSKGYLISEFNGHMFPTKSFDDEGHRREHMLRHARVIDAYYKEKDIAGGFGWCMFDYNTHKDFGSGDYICYHGVMDIFRNRKDAGYLYSAQAENEPVLELSSSMDIGEHPGGIVREVYAITNADRLRLYRNGTFIKEYGRRATPFHHMPHGPVLIDDFIGDRLQIEEGFSKKKAGDVKRILLAARQFGMAKLPAKEVLLAEKCRILGGLKREDAVALYNKYIGDWGQDAAVYRLDAIKDGKVVKRLEKGPAKALHMEVKVSHETLVEGATYDVAAIRIQAEDNYGNRISFYQEPIQLKTIGDIELIGPEIISLKGGMGGTFVRTLGTAGSGSLHIEGGQLGEAQVFFQIVEQK